MTGGPAERTWPGAGRLSSRSGSAGSGTKPAVCSSSNSWSSVRNTCGLPENCVKTNDSPATGVAFEGSVQAGEGEHEQRRFGCRHPGGLCDRPSKLEAGARQVPDAVRDDEVHGSAANRQSIHRGEDETQIDTGSPFRRRTEHRPRQVRADDRHPRLRERYGIAPGTAADVEHAQPLAMTLPVGVCHQHRVGRRLRKAGHGAGRAPCRSSQRLHTDHYGPAREPAP